MSRNVLLDFMATPMAAPETPALRTMRRCWVALCTCLCAGVSGISLWVGLIGQWASALVLVLVISTPCVGWIYFSAKIKADDAWNARESDA
jgi:hypothetical protein